MLDMAYAVLVEVYREYGMKFDEATKEIQKAISEPDSRQRKEVTAQEEAASMAMLQSMMGGSDFRGPKG